MASVSVNTSLQSEDQRLIYLMTYSRADTSHFPSRSSFSEAVLEGWENCGVRVLHWVVSLEAHADTDNSVSNEINNSYHYHMAVKLSKCKRWLQVRKFLDERYGIKVHFSDIHNTYYTAYRYVTKEDSEALHSSNHPDLQEVPRTERAIACKRSKGKLSERGKKNKKSPQKRLAVYDVTQLIQQKKIKSRLELVCLAVEQQREGKTELAEFIANRGNMVVDEALSLALEFSQAEEKFARSKKTRIEILEECQQQQCSEGCGGKWIVAAERLLGAHGIVVNAFCNAIYTALKEGRGKYRNVYIYGPANTGKTFILSPLKKIVHAFCNPATGSFAWMGAQGCRDNFSQRFSLESSNNSLGRLPSSARGRHRASSCP